MTASDADVAMSSDEPMLIIRNVHVDPAPDFNKEIEEGDYVSYYENYHGEQWVFIRKSGADSATVYGGDIGWEPVEVRERTPEEVRESLAAQGVKRVGMLADMTDPLVPNLILNEGERTWLKNAWWTSGDAFDQDARDRDLAAIARRLAKKYETPAMRKHPNSNDYRSAMMTFTLMVGREAGQRGLSERETGILVQEALAALNAEEP